MNKTYKKICGLTGQVITYTVSEELNKLDPQKLAPKQLAAANAFLRKLKTPLPTAPTQ